MRAVLTAPHGSTQIVRPTSYTLLFPHQDCTGAWCELGLMPGACLAFMLVGNDGLCMESNEGKTGRQWDREREFFIDSNSSVFQSCGRVP
jgi:hypothetical protein